MWTRRWLILLILAAALMLGCGGYGTWGYSSGDWYDNYDNYDHYTNCPRHWIIGPLDCDACHW